jgi:NAD-dependent SIR2 family protein deacetylase
MPGHTTIILGAGFSKPAGGPLLQELLSADNISKSKASQSILNFIIRYYNMKHLINQSFSVEELFTEIWREARTGGNIRLDNEEHNADGLLSNLTIHLSSICGQVHLRRSTTIWQNYLSYLYDLFQSSKSLDIISFNYDLLTEQLLDDLDINFDYGFKEDIYYENSVRRRRLNRKGSDISILKLHGSANWGICRGCRKTRKADDHIIAFEQPYVPNRRKRCPLCNERYLSSGIIPPIIGKAGEVHYMEEVWRSARIKLQRAREIHIIGYSLPTTDLEARSLLKEIERIDKRPRINIICGPEGAPGSYQNVITQFKDEKKYFEKYIEDID